jgi:hypothetical protein
VPSPILLILTGLIFTEVRSPALFSSQGSLKNEVCGSDAVLKLQ